MKKFFKPLSIAYAVFATSLVTELGAHASVLAPTAVPEPSSWVAFAIGGAGLAAFVVVKRLMMTRSGE